MKRWLIRFATVIALAVVAAVADAPTSATPVLGPGSGAGDVARGSAMLGGRREAGAVAALPGVLDGAVYALVSTGGKVFVGGEFARMGKPTGPLVAFTARGVREARFPSVELGGKVSAVVADGAGGWFVGGSFRSIGGVDCPNLAHVRGGGSIDRGFCPRPQGEVSALALGGSRLYVGGWFENIAGVARERLAALDLRSGRATAFRVKDARLPVAQLVGSPAAVYARGGSYFCDFVAFDPTSGRRLRFAPNPSAVGKTNCVSGFAVTGERVFAWGSFSRIGGAGRARLAALDAVTGKALDWGPHAALAADPRHAPWVSAGVVVGSTLYVAGCFEAVNGQARAGLAAFSVDTGRLLPWRARGLPCGWQSLAAAAGVLYELGPGNVAGSAVIARSLSSGAALPFRAASLNGSAEALAVADGAVVVGGEFGSVGGIALPHLFALDPVTNKPLSWRPRVSGAVERLAVAGSTLYTAGSLWDDVSSGDGFAAFDVDSGRRLLWRPPPVYSEGLAANSHAVYTARLDNGDATLLALDPRTGAVLQANPIPPFMSLSASQDVVFAGNVRADEGYGVAAIDPSSLQIRATVNTPNIPGVQTLAAAGHSVYAAGDFTTFDTVRQPYLARLTLSGDKLLVDPLRPRLPGPVHALALSGNAVLAAGPAGKSGRWYAATIDRSRGTVRILGYGTNHVAEVSAIAGAGRNVYVGDTLGLHLLRR